MITCKYCGQTLKEISSSEHNQLFNCNFCDMEFPIGETCINRKRKVKEIRYHEFTDIYLSTQQFLERDTLTLYHALKEIRRFWYDIKILLEKIKSSLNKVEDFVSFQELKSEFIILTKKRFIVENILLERTGYIPEKITEKFLDNLVLQAEISINKPMYIYLK